MMKYWKRGSYIAKKKTHNENVNITEMYHISFELTITNLDPRPSDPSQLCLTIRTHDLQKNPKENFKLKRNSRWPTTRTLDLPSSPGPWGVFIADWFSALDPPPLGPK